MAKDLKVEDYEALAVASTGLVPMRFLKGTITEREGDIAGYEPYTAKRMHDEGLAEPVKAIKAGDDSKKQAVTGETDDARRAAIVIDDAWEGQHHLKRIAVAKDIAGSKADLTADNADIIIRAEIARRAAA